MARAHLWRPLDFSAAVETACHIFRRLWPRPVSDAVRTAFVSEAFLPLSFEWSAAALPLAMTGIIVGGWLWLLTVPLVVTWVMCINGARKAPIDERFNGVK